MPEVYTCPNCGEEMEKGADCSVCDHKESEVCDCETCEEVDNEREWEDDDDEAN